MKKINNQFVILQCIAITLVVIGHSGGIMLFSEWFPIYSFHMPLFIFISGYFFKEENDTNLLMFIKKKFKRLMIPFFVWNLFYGILAQIISAHGIYEFVSKINLRSILIEPFINGHQFAINVSSWFVPTIFLVQIIFVLLTRIMKEFKINNYIIKNITFFIIGLFSVILVGKGYIGGIKLVISRILFLLPIYYLGVVYNQKLEKKDTLNNMIYFIVLFFIQYILIRRYENLAFSVVWMDGFNKENIILPYITSITGIMFWLRVSKILVKSLSESRIIEYIGRNTWTVMMHHQIIFFIINSFFWILSNIIKLVKIGRAHV